jgi:hypothetical protein
MDERDRNDYPVLVGLLYPFALSRFDAGFRDWGAADVKATGLLAVDLALLALLVAEHGSVNALWWLPGLAWVAAGVLFAAALAPRSANDGPSVLRLHDALRRAPSRPADAARTMINVLVVARRENNRARDGKLRLVQFGFVALALGAAACVPIALLRPG